MLSDGFRITAPSSARLVLLDFAVPGFDHFAMSKQAIRQNDVGQMEAILQKPQDPNLMIEGRPALHFAVEAGHRTAAQLWLEAGADVNHADMPNGTTALLLAARSGNVSVPRLLLDWGADKDKAATDGSTPLIVAASAGHLEVTRLLLGSGADKNKTGRGGYTIFTRQCHVDAWKWCACCWTPAQTWTKPGEADLRL